MDEKTAAIVEKLADKLGVTAEYLWGVLIKQAPIDAAIGALTFLVLAVVSWAAIRFARKLLSDGEKERDEGKIIAGIAAGGVAACISVAFTISFFQLGDVLTAIVNPEYHALDKILRRL